MAHASKHGMPVPAEPTAAGARALLSVLEGMTSGSPPDTLPQEQPFAAGSGDARLLELMHNLLERLRERERQVEELADRYDLIIHGADDGLWDWNLHTDEVYFSPRWKEILGYQENEVSNTFDEWRSRVHPDDLPRAMAALRAHLDDGAPYELEHRLRHRDGSYRWIQSRGASSRDADGKAVRFAGAHWDITARKEADELLHEKEEQYRGVFEASTDALIIYELETGCVVEANPAACRMYGYTHEEFLGLDFPAYVHPSQHAYVGDFLTAARSGRGLRRLALNVRKDGTAFHVQVQGSAFSYRGQPHLLGVLRDVTDEVESYQRLEQRVEERTRELTTLLEVSHNVSSTLELQPLLGVILDQLRVVADYDGASISLLEGGSLRMIVRRAPTAMEPEEMAIPVERARVLWDAISLREPLVIGDIQDSSPLARAFRAAIRGPFADSPFRYIRSWMSVPLARKEQVFGMITLAHGEPRFYTPRHAALATAIANQAATAIENAQLYEQARRLAALEERQRLARDLHDSVSQVLFSIGLSARTARTLLDRDPPRAVRPVESLISLAEMGMAEMRALLFELRPESLESEGLVVALTKQASSLRARHSVDVDVTLCEEPDVPLEVKEAVYRIAQEAMHNTVKHARASHIDVRLTCDPAAIQVEVEDDGVGFDPSAVLAGHLGLVSMRERVIRFGGTLHVESAPGEGATIRAVVPLR